MSDVVIFTGPTLRPEAVTDRLDARVLPPAAHGDVLRAALTRPRVIGIIDGVFDRLPAIWHKEILWALSQGIAVYGAASMGALRACELAPYGMRGVGAVYEAFASGELEDDDEVAILHGDAGDGYHNLSDAMVDIRATLARAHASGMLSADELTQVLDTAKSMPYTDRRLQQVLSGPSHEGLRAWVATHHRSQKELDAIELVETIARELDDPTPSDRFAWTFQHTQYWEAAYQRVLAESSTDVVGHEVHAVSERDTLGQLLDETRLDPDRHRVVEERALVMLLASTESLRSGAGHSTNLVESAVAEMLRSEGVLDEDRLAVWLDERGLSTTDLDWIKQRWVDHRFARRAYSVALPAEIVRELKVTGEFGPLADRAEQKRRALDTAPVGRDQPAPSDLISWYFVDCLGRTPPVQLDAWSRHHGWRDAADLLRALGREWVFRHVAQHDA